MAYIVCTCCGTSEVLLWCLLHWVSLAVSWGQWWRCGGCSRRCGAVVLDLIPTGCTVKAALLVEKNVPERELQGLSRGRTLRCGKNCYTKQHS